MKKTFQIILLFLVISGFCIENGEKEWAVAIIRVVRNESFAVQALTTCKIINSNFKINIGQLAKVYDETIGAVGDTVKLYKVPYTTMWSLNGTYKVPW